MYRTIIEMKEDTPKETLAEIKALCIAAHKNRAGEVKMKPINDRTFVFEGGEEKYGCLMLATSFLDKNELFMKKIKSWLWEDEDPEEDCDILKAVSMPIVV